MKSWTKLLICMYLVSVTSFVLAEDANNKDVNSKDVNSAPAPAAEVNLPAFPYMAEITGENVNIRSGAGTNYYLCGKLNKGDKVQVVDCKFGMWSCIVPPAGCYSLIAKQNVKVDVNSPSVGIVTAPDVHVYAGSPSVRPMYSAITQVQLAKGDKVEVLGEAEDYYKITPPSGAYLWVNANYLTSSDSHASGRPAEAVSVSEPNSKSVNVKKSAESPGIKPAAVPPVTVESKMMTKYYELVKQMEAERKKPIAEQNFAPIKQSLTDIINNKESGRAGRYSEFVLKQIKRYELGSEVEKTVKMQEEQLKQTKEGIEKAHAARIEGVQDLSKYAIIGKFQISHIYGETAAVKMYRIMDEKGVTVCYARPYGPAEKMDLTGFIGKKVGLVGTFEPYTQIKSVLVKFTEIKEMQ